MNLKKGFCSLAAVLLTSSTGYALPNEIPDNHWQFSIAPYIWALNMNGTVQVANARAHIDQSFNDILNHLNAAGMVWLDAYKNNVGLFANALYASLSDTDTQGAISAKAQNIFAIYSAGISYRAYKFYSATSDRTLVVEPYLGARYTRNDTRVTLTTPTFVLKNTDNQNWTDPIVGVRFNIGLTKAWSALLAGDIGGTNASSHYSYNVVGLLGYKPQTVMKYSTWYLGYRLLDQHYISGSGINYFNWNMKLFGPMAGVAFTF